MYKRTYIITLFIILFSCSTENEETNKDTETPTVEIENLANNDVVESDAIIRIKASDNNEVKHIIVQLNNTKNDTIKGNKATYKLVSKEKQVTLHIFAEDVAGNISDKKTLSLNIIHPKVTKYTIRKAFEKFGYFSFNFTAFEVDLAGTVWIGSSTGDLVSFDGQKTQKYALEELKNTSVIDIKQFGDESLYVLLSDKLLVYKNGAFTSLTPEINVPIEMTAINRLHSKLYISNRSGVIEYDLSTSNWLFHSLKENRLFSDIEISEQGLILTYSDDDIYVSENNVWKVISPLEEFHATTYKLHFQNEDILGYFSGGFFLYTNGKWKPFYRLPPSLTNDQNYSFDIGKSGALWYVTDQSLYKVYGKFQERTVLDKPVYKVIPKDKSTWVLYNDFEFDLIHFEYN